MSIPPVNNKPRPRLTPEQAAWKRMTVIAAAAQGTKKPVLAAPRLNLGGKQ